jgi:hypothetical protein
MAWPWTWAMVIGHVPEVHVDIGDLLHACAGAHDQAAALVVAALVGAVDGVGAAAAGWREVVTGAKTAPGAAHDDDTRRGVGFEVVEGVVEFEEELLGEGVHLLGAVECDARDAGWCQRSRG